MEDKEGEEGAMQKRVFNGMQWLLEVDIGGNHEHCYD